MTILQSVLLSIVEGITEFLPVSSTGHLIIVSNLLKIPQTDFVKSFEIIIQLGAILAVIIIYRKTIFNNIKIWKKIITAFIPTGILGLALYKIIKKYFLGNLNIVLISLFIGGILLIILELIYKKRKCKLIENTCEIKYKDAFIIGIFQSLSMIPGVSRSAASIYGGLIRGLNRKTAVEFSFLLAIPTMFAAVSLDIIKSGPRFSQNEILILVIGFITTFFVSYIVAKLFIKFIKNHDFIIFGVYRILLALIFWTLMIR